MDLVKLVSAAEMAAIDRRSIEEGGISATELMERAGRGVYEIIQEEWEGLEGLDLVVVCGKGNNGGDGFVVARLLHQARVTQRIFLAAEKGEVGRDAAHHLELLESAGAQIERLRDPEDVKGFEVALKASDLVVDALLGTGIRGAPRPEMERIIDLIGECGSPVVAVDLPSGLDADTGQIHGACVNATLTVTFGVPKIGQMFFPGRSRCGVLRLVDIGFPAEVLASSPSTACLLTEERMGTLVPQRPGDAHKGRCGAVAVVAGSAGMTGAAALTAESALRSGAGRVSLGTPASLNDILEVKLTEVMTRPLPEVRKHRCLALRALGELLRLFPRCDCVAMGPGLGRHRETMELVRRLVPRAGRPVVLDADGLNAFAGATDKLKDVDHPLILTPHIGEFARLSELSKEEILEDPMARARRFALDFGLTLVLKGAPTVIATSSGKVLVNPSGNAGMATAGSGDVLTGLIAGFLAQGLAPEDAACLGVYIHGRAGDAACDKIGEWGMTAGDIASKVPGAILDTYRAT